MFRVLTNRRKSRLTSPRFIAGSVAVHLVVALVAVNVSRAAPAPAAEPEPPPIRYFPIDQPVAPTPDPTPAPPRREGSTRELVAPDKVPDRIPAPDPTERPVDLSQYSGQGPIGDTVVAHPRPPLPDQPRGTAEPRPRDFHDGPAPVELADVRPTLANLAEASRLLQRHYPAGYADAGVSGRTVVEVVVEETGRVRPGSARIVTSSDPLFGEATLRIIERMRFRPALIAEQPIAVIVQIPIEWRPAN